MFACQWQEWREGPGTDEQWADACELLVTAIYKFVHLIDFYKPCLNPAHPADKAT